MLIIPICLIENVYQKYGARYFLGMMKWMR